MFAFPDMFHFFPYEFAGLRGRRFTFAFVFARSFNRLFFWHSRVDRR
jgi:hypothetical protein